MNTSKLMTNKFRVLTAALAIAGGAAAPALISSAAAQTAAQQVPRGVLSGRYQGLAFTVYGPGTLGNFSGDAATTLRVSAHSQARILGAKWLQPNIVVAFRVSAPIATVYRFHDEQITSQGFTRTAQNLSDNQAAATYERAGRTIDLTIRREAPDSYRATIQLGGGDTSAVQGGTQQSGAVGANQPAGAGLAQPVTQDLGRLNVRVIPAGTTMPNNSGTPTTLVLMPYQGASNTTVNFTGNTVFLGYFTDGTLDQVYQDVDRQLRAQGFEPQEVNRASNGGAVNATYQRGGASLSLDVELRDRSTGGYRVVANLDDLVGSLDRQAGGNAATPVTPARPVTPATPVTPARPVTPGTAAGAGGSVIEGAADNGLGFIVYGAGGQMPMSADQQRIMLAAPQDAVDVKASEEGDGVRIFLESPGSLDDIYNFYAQQMAQQGFERVGDPSSADARRSAVYARGNTRVGLTVTNQGASAGNRINYEVLVDFAGRAEGL